MGGLFSQLVQTVESTHTGRRFTRESVANAFSGCRLFSFIRFVCVCVCRCIRLLYVILSLSFAHHFSFFLCVRLICARAVCLLFPFSYFFLSRIFVFCAPVGFCFIHCVLVFYFVFYYTTIIVVFVISTCSCIFYFSPFIVAYRFDPVFMDSFRF